ncbi:MAG: VanZ family protein [Peptostreptococcaceae bacterium]
MESNKKIALLVLIISWMGFIFYLSNQPASVSAGQSGRLINSILGTPIIGTMLTPILTSSIGEFLIRKSAHMFLYFILAILVFSYIIKRNIELTNKILIKQMIITITVVFLYACTDEIHQLYIPGRSGEFRDVMVDTTGGIIGTLLASGIYIQLNKTKKRIQ